MTIKKIHTYVASFGDDLARGLIVENSRVNDVVLDPFMGSSTTLIQARELGRSAIGIDVDPVACLIARVVTERYSLDELHNFSNQVKDTINGVHLTAINILNRDSILKAGDIITINGNARYIPNNSKIDFWFSPIQIAVLAALTNVANSLEIPKFKDILLLTISSAIVHKWPNTISLAKDIDHSRPHRVCHANISIESQLRIFRRCFNNTIRKLIEIVNNTATEETNFRVIEEDVITALSLLEKNSIDYVLTSPPYFNAIDYPRAHKFSEWWLWPETQPVNSRSYIGLKPGGKAKDDSYANFVEEIIPHNVTRVLPICAASPSLYRKLCLYIIDMKSVFIGLREVMREGAPLNLVIANNVVRDIEVPVVDIMIELLENTGFARVEPQERIIQENRRRYPYGIAGFNGLMKVEYIIRCQKPIQKKVDSDIFQRAELS